MKNTQLYPIVTIEPFNTTTSWENHYPDVVHLSTNNVTLNHVHATETAYPDLISNVHFKPILLNIPSIKESIDIESRKFKISSVSLDVSNYEYGGKRFTDILSDTSLINWKVSIQFVSPSAKKFTTIFNVDNYDGDISFYEKYSNDDNFKDEITQMVYQGVIRRITHDNEKVKVELEDLTEQKTHKDLPNKNLPDTNSVPDKYKNSPIPMVYGHVEKSPVVADSNFNIFRIDYKDIQGNEEVDNNSGFNDSSDEQIDFGSLMVDTGEDTLYIEPKYGVINQYEFIDNYFTYTAGSSPLCTYKPTIKLKIQNQQEPNEGGSINDEVSSIFNEDFLMPEYPDSSFIGMFDGDYSNNLIGIDAKITRQTSTGNMMIFHYLGFEISIDYKNSFKLFDDSNPPFLIGFKINNLNIASYVENNSHVSSNDYDNYTAITDTSIAHYENINNIFGFAEYYTTSAGTNYGVEDDINPLANLIFDVQNNVTLGNVIIRPRTNLILFKNDRDLSEFKIQARTIGQYDFQVSVDSGGNESIHPILEHTISLEGKLNEIELLSRTVPTEIFDDNFYANVNGRINTFDDHPDDNMAVDDFIQNPIDIIYDILRSELGLSAKQIDVDDYKEAKSAHDDWKFGFTVDKKIHSKKLIEEIAKSTKCFPNFKNDGTFAFNTIKNSYSEEDYNSSIYIKEEDVINYSIKKTKPEQIISEVGVKYKKDYSQNSYLKDVFTYTDSNYNYQKYNTFNAYPENFAYYGIDEPENSFLEVESDYIRDDHTAHKLREFLFQHYKNDHLIFNIKLPIFYNKINIGDLIRFDKLLNNMTAHGIDYTQTIMLNGQTRYPLFMITSIKKNLDSVEIECMQLHHLQGELEALEGDTEAPVITISGGNLTVSQGDTFDLPTYTVSDVFDENPTVVTNYTNEDKIINNGDGTATAFESGLVNFQVFAEDSSGNQASAFTNITINASHNYINDNINIDGWYMGSIIWIFADAYDNVPEAVQVNSNQFWFGINHGHDLDATIQANNLVSALFGNINYTTNALHDTGFFGAVQVEGMQNPADDGLYGIQMYASPIPENWNGDGFYLWFNNLILFTKITADIYQAQTNDQVLIEESASSFDTSLPFSYIQNAQVESRQLDYTEIQANESQVFPGDPLTPTIVNDPDFSDPNEGEGSNAPSRNLTLNLIPLDPIPPQAGYAGDMNQDGSVNILDIVTIVNATLGGQYMYFNNSQYNQSNYPSYFDFNQDGFLNILDVVGLVDFLLEDA